MVTHRAPEQRTLHIGAAAAPGPVEPVDTAQTQAIDMTVSAGEGKRPEPVMNAAKLAGAISGVILSVGGLLKLATPWVPADYSLQAVADQASDAVLSLGLAWALVGPWITALVKARDKVTPLADPRDITGRPLVPAPTAVRR